MMSGQAADFGPTPSQTVGPFFAYGLTARQYGYDFGQPFDDVVALPEAPGQHIVLEGRVLDGDGQPIMDAMVEISQADSAGRYPAAIADVKASGFRAFGRMGTGTDPELRFRFRTVKPGAEGPGQAPHINVIVLMRGLLLHAFTRVYFSDEAQANASDAALQSVPAERRSTLIAQRQDKGGVPVYTFDIHMQGAQETVFFDV
ncbi:protocatechuate 3,4-dioxygenase subunit alpha [Caenimonas sp. DR4.4]|uniref:Protocatechuate 3,4-dioxygenase subunit alpha n=2 Tax=Caenimonas aquaedulcis TaxID=2793270 RepID=A0A931H6E4_9BURK|nr:protocatechuate 3,4-dioxygenase subunit alpha [Caenimonas aquaedulcis]